MSYENYEIIQVKFPFGGFNLLYSRGMQAGLELVRLIIL